MTKEEREKAIELLDNLIGMIEDNHNSDYDMAFKMGIEALKQEPILDKIRAEMVDLGQRTMNDNRAGGIWTCVDILDKYKKESEG